MANSKYDIWFCNCGRIHFYPRSDWDWMTEDHEHRRSIQVCRNCGALYEHFLTENGWTNEDGNPSFDLNGYSYHNEDRIVIDEEDQIQRRWYIDKGIKVPLKEGGYADGYWSNIYFNAEYMNQKGYPSDISENCQHKDCITVDTNKLIKKVKQDYPEIFDDLLYSISGYISGIDWDGTPYSYKVKHNLEEE